MAHHCTLSRSLLVASLLCCSLTFVLTEAEDIVAPERQGGLSRSLLQDTNGEPGGSGVTFAWSWRTGLMLAITFVMSALSMPAGIGGGLIFVPLLNTLLQLSPRASGAQAQPLILGGALGSAWITLARRHPSQPKRPLIDFQILLLLMPLMMAGVCAGVLLNNTFPNWLITVLLFTALVYQLWASSAKTLALMRAQKQAQAQAAAAQHQQGPEQPPAAAEEVEQRQTLLQEPRRGQSAASDGPGGLELSPVGGSPRALATAQQQQHPVLQRLSGISQVLRAGSYPEIPSLSPGWMELQDLQMSRTSSEPQDRLRGQTAGEEGEWAICSTGAAAAPLHAHSMPAAAPGAARVHRTSPAADARALAAATAGGAGTAALRVRSLSVALPSIPSVGQRLDALVSAPAAASRPGGSPKEQVATGSGCKPPIVSSGGGADNLPQHVTLTLLANKATGAVRQVADEMLRLPHFDHPTLRRLGVVGGIWAGFVALQATRGATSKARGTQCFAAYYGLLAVEFVLLLGAAAGYTVHVVQKRRRVAARTAEQDEGKRSGVAATAEGEAGAEAIEGQNGVQACWSLRKIIVVQAIAAVGGTLATMLGLGGGLVMGPLLLALDVHPLVASATSSFMVLLTVSSATITYAIQSQLVLSYSLIYGASCMLGALLGVLVVNRVVRATGATWVVVALMTCVVAAGAVICASISMPNAVRSLVDGTGVGFTTLCDH